MLPSPEVLDKIMRCETTLHRHMYRAMSQLERLQRMRQGEAVPPPMTMGVLLNLTCCERNPSWMISPKTKQEPPMFRAATHQPAWHY